MKLSAIIPFYNQQDLTWCCLASLAAASLDGGELILIDNGSSNGANTAVPEPLIAQTQYLRNEENLGVTKAWNQGIERATRDYLAFLNNDIVLAPQCLEILCAVLDEHPDVWCVSPLTVRGEAQPPDLAEREAALIGFRPPLVPAMAGWCFVIRRTALNQIWPPDGYFDERLKLWYGDVFVQRWLDLAGHPWQVATDALCYHAESRTLATIPNYGEQVAKDAAAFHEIIAERSMSELEKELA